MLQVFVLNCCSNKERRRKCFFNIWQFYWPIDLLEKKICNLQIAIHYLHFVLSTFYLSTWYPYFSTQISCDTIWYIEKHRGALWSVKGSCCGASEPQSAGGAHHITLTYRQIEWTNPALIYIESTSSENFFFFSVRTCWSAAHSVQRIRSQNSECCQKTYENLSGIYQSLTL